MDYADLTQEQKDLLDEFDRWLRGTIRSLVAFADEADFNLKQQFYNDQIVPILTALTDGEVIPSSSGLAGIVDVTDVQTAGAAAWVFGIQDDIDTNLSLVVKLIGINA